MAKRSRHDSTSTTDSAGSSSPVSNYDPEEDVHTPKYTETEESPSTRPLMQCSLPPHKPLSFTKYTDYEAHYRQTHSNRCTECGKNFPTTHFLELHISENHDPIVAARSAKGEKTFACFVEGCDKVCGEWQKRRSHLVDRHGFPRNYDFFVVNSGIDGRRSLLRPGVDAQGHRQSSRERRDFSGASVEGAADVVSTSSSNSTPVQSQGPPTKAPQKSSATPLKEHNSTTSKSSGALDDLTASMSTLKMVPRSVTFGRRKGRGGLASK